MERIELTYDAKADESVIAEEIYDQIKILDISREIACAISMGASDDVTVFKDGGLVVAIVPGGAMVNERSPGIGDSFFVEDTADPSEIARRFRDGEL